MNLQWILNRPGKGTIAFLFACALTTAAVDGADADATREVMMAFERLSAAENYTFYYLQREQGRKEAEEVLCGRTERSGWTCLRLKVAGGYACDFVFNGKRGVVAAAGSDWMTAEEVQSPEFRAKMSAESRQIIGRTAVATLKGFRSPPEQAIAIAKEVAVFRSVGNRRIGDVKPETRARMFGPQTSRYTLWVEINKGLARKFGFQHERVAQTLDKREEKTVGEFIAEITAVGTTEVKVPDAAKKRLQ